MGGNFFGCCKIFWCQHCHFYQLYTKCEKLESFVLYDDPRNFSQRQHWWFVTETHFSFMRIVFEQCMKQVSPTFCNVMYRYACAHFTFNSHSVQSINTIWTCVNRKSWTAVPAASCSLRHVAVLHVKRFDLSYKFTDCHSIFRFTKANNDLIHYYSFWFGRKQGFL